VVGREERGGEGRKGVGGGRGIVCHFFPLFFCLFFFVVVFVFVVVVVVVVLVCTR